MPLPLIAAGLGSLLIKELPSIAAWIFGDGTGKAIEAVTGAARQVFGTDDPAGLEAAIAADPAKALEFKRIVLEAEASVRTHIEAVRQQDIDTIKAQLADVASARIQTVELAKAGSAIAWGAPIMSVLITVGFFLMLYLVIRREIPEGSRDLANIMLGSLGTSFTAVVAYWVGSSAGSAQKTNALEMIAGTRSRA